MKKTFISLFSGAGGLDQGFIQAGWEPIFMTDIWEAATNTLEKNHSGCLIKKFDIIDITKQMIADIIGTRKVLAVIGGPPCQAFSRLNQNKIFESGELTEENMNDPRRSLFMDFLRIVSYINPPFVVMENVADLKVRKLGGTTNQKDSLIVEIIYNEFSRNGYDVKADVLWAQDYGVPQKRKRMIFVAVKKGIGIKLSFPPKVTLDISVDTEFKKILLSHPNQEIKNHNEEWISKVKLIPAGGYYNNLPVEHKVLKSIDVEFIKKDNGQFRQYCFISPEGYVVFNKTKDGKFVTENNVINESELKNIEIFKIMPRMGTYLRRIGKDISHTITRNPLIHPDEHRELTVREKASIQTFPPNYEFVGTIQEQHLLVGNAVPCNFGEHIARHIERISNG